MGFRGRLVREFGLVLVIIFRLGEDISGVFVVFVFWIRENCENVFCYFFVEDVFLDCFKGLASFFKGFLYLIERVEVIECVFELFYVSIIILCIRD